MAAQRILKLTCLLAAAGILAACMQSCDTKMYEDCPPGHIVGEWGVVDHTRTFGEYDSLYYVVNPIANINDSVYYNGNYTDSYYHSDPVRVMLRYTLEDSIFFNLDRQYATITNPRNIIMTVTDSVSKTDRGSRCILHMRRGENDENLYRSGPDSLFREMLLSGRELRVMATNGPSSSEPAGSQNYEFVLYSDGFGKALAMADSLNKARVTLRKDSIKSKDTQREATPGNGTEI